MSRFMKGVLPRLEPGIKEDQKTHLNPHQPEKGA